MQNTLTPTDPDSDEKYAPKQGAHDDLGVSPDQASREVADLEKQFADSGDEPNQEGSAASGSGALGGLGTKGLNAAPLKQQESDAADDAVGKGINLEDFGKKGLNKGISTKLPSWITKKRVAVFGGIAGVSTTGIILSILGLSSGPGRLIQMGQILNLPNNRESVVSRIRSNDLYRYARTGDVGETRVGRVGSKVFASTLADLKVQGVEFQRTTYTGNPKTMTVDTSKDPAYKGMSEAEAKAAVAKKYGLNESQLFKISGLNGAKYGVNTRDIGMQASRALQKNAVASLENGKVISAMKFRVMSKFFNTPSLFHPWEKAKATAENKLGTFLERRVSEEKRAAAKKPAISPEAQAAYDRIKGSLDPVKKATTGVLLLSAVMCLARQVADDVITLNDTQVKQPAAQAAVETEAMGSQIENGQDFTAGQVQSKIDSLKGDDGTQPEDARAYQALYNPNASIGPDISGDYAQAFSSDNTAQIIKDTIGGGGLGAVACSPIGQVVQVVASIGILVSGFFDGGLSWAAVGAKVGTELAQTAATAGAMALIEHKVTDMLASKAIIPALLSGAEGGNLLAYGAREAANMSARASGGVALDADASRAIDVQTALDEQNDFKTHSLYARLFDKNDYRSLSSRVAMNIRDNPVGKATQYLSSLSFSKMSASVIGAVVPKANAAETAKPYLWSFPRYTIPNSLLNDPNYEDPYANADAIAKVFDGPNVATYTDRAAACFGVSINKDGGDGWRVVPGNLVNPQSQEYTDAHCNDLSDTNWKRTILFIMDSRTMDAIACYQGDDGACALVKGEVATAAPAAGAAGTVSPTGWAWPVSKADWDGPFGTNVWGNVYCGASCGRHEGVDFSPLSSTASVLVAHDGVVKAVTYNGECQWSVLISVNGQSVFQGYQHLTRPTLVAGQNVTVGTKVGTIYPSSSGSCIQGPHLHFSIEKTAQISSYSDGAGKSDADMPTLPPLCILPNDGRNYGSSVPADKIIGSAYCTQLAGGV